MQAIHAINTALQPYEGCNIAPVPFLIQSSAGHGERWIVPTLHLS